MAQRERAIVHEAEEAALQRAVEANERSVKTEAGIMEQVTKLLESQRSSTSQMMQNESLKLHRAYEEELARCTNEMSQRFTAMERPLMSFVLQGLKSRWQIWSYHYTQIRLRII